MAPAIGPYLMYHDGNFNCYKIVIVILATGAQIQNLHNKQRRKNNAQVESTYMFTLQLNEFS